MLCPEDGRELTDDRKGLASCPRCLGHAISGEAFSASHQEIQRILRVEQARDSGAHARVRDCPQCHRAMSPLRMGDQLAWLDWCERCDVLWVEKLDRAVIDRLERRIALARAVGSLSPEERREMARDIAGEMVEEQRQLRFIAAIREVLYGLE